jgi:glycopeptide antibiotics resistance protein
MQRVVARSSEIRSQALLFVSTTLLFVFLWAEILWRTYRNWSGLHADIVPFAVLFPVPWLITLKHRDNNSALLVSCFSYLLLADAVRMMHL